MSRFLDWSLCLEILKVEQEIEGVVGDEKEGYLCGSVLSISVGKLQPWADGFVLLIEGGEIWHQVPHDWHVWKWVDLRHRVRHGKKEGKLGEREKEKGGVYLDFFSRN